MDINDQQIADQLKEQGIINFSRIMSKSKQVTSLLKAKAIDQDTYQSWILNKLKIGYIRCHTEPCAQSFSVWNARRLVILIFICKSETVCPKWSGNHSLKECLIENKVKCINSGGDHFACSWKCTFLKEAAKNQKNSTQNNIPAANPFTKTFAQVTKVEKPSQRWSSTQ